MHWGSYSFIYHSCDRSRYDSIGTPFSNFLIIYVFVAISVGRVGTCRFDSSTFLDHSNESCAALWRNIQRVQIIAVVLAGVVLCAQSVFSSMNSIGSRIFVQNTTTCGDCLRYPHADEGAQ